MVAQAWFDGSHRAPQFAGPLVEILGLAHQAPLGIELHHERLVALRVMECQLLMAAAGHITSAEQQISLALQQVLIAAAGQKLLLPVQLPLLPLYELLQVLLQPLALLLALGLPQSLAVVTRQGEVEGEGRLGWNAACLSPACLLYTSDAADE